MDTQTHLTMDAIATQAMENLVNQFARPMDFLRELAQNSMDAGTPRIDVIMEYEPGEPSGVLSIHVVDYGDGMDEEIIDKQLTRLFSSNKENDLTKIGKFGIGFTSIFAIKPEAVLLQTGRHGEYWELLFHADRSYEKRALTEPVSGTKITLFKRFDEEEAAKFVKEAQFVLTYWCEHSEIPIYFEDKTQKSGSQSATAEDADPFAAFSSSAEANNTQRVDGPLAMEDADLVYAEDGPNYSLVIGYDAQPTYGFYNAGLTLVSSHSPDVLGDYAKQLQHVSFKIKCDDLEHTLTRDNVLQDEQWHKMMDVLLAAHQKLRDRLLERVLKAVASGASLGLWYRYLAEELQLDGAAIVQTKEHHAAPLFVDVGGQTFSLQQLEQQEAKYGVVFYDPGTTRLSQEMRAKGFWLLQDTPTVRAVVDGLQRPRIWGVYRAPRVSVNAGDWFLLPELIEVQSLPEAERRFILAVDEWVQFGSRRRLSVGLGTFGGIDEALTEGLVIAGPEDGVLFQRIRKTLWGLKENAGTCFLLNKHHPYYASMLALAAEDFVSAVYMLTMLLFTESQLGPEDVHSILQGYAANQLELEGTQ